LVVADDASDDMSDEVADDKDETDIAGDYVAVSD
jgi:hypothetical protein